MPTISVFYGIVIAMFYNDHDPPHFHAQYGGETGWITIDGPQLFRGSIPRRQLQLVLAWATLHRDELRLNWSRARAGQPVERITPLT